MTRSYLLPLLTKMLALNWSFNWNFNHNYSFFFLKTNDTTPILWLFSVWRLMIYLIFMIETLSTQGNIFDKKISLWSYSFSSWYCIWMSFVPLHAHCYKNSDFYLVFGRFSDSFLYHLSTLKLNYMHIYHLYF